MTFEVFDKLNEALKTLIEEIETIQHLYKEIYYILVERKENEQ